MTESLLIFGASVRAAAFSALRAGLRPWCADLFADADLHGCCPVRRIPPGDYPDGLLEIVKQAPPGPWLYTGGLENRVELVRRLARERPLWGNDAAVLEQVRRAERVAEVLRAANLNVPALRWPGDKLPKKGRWLIKPIAGTGGAGIRFHDRERKTPRKPVYFQEFIEGESVAAIYIGEGTHARLLGVTRQLVGEAWLNAAPFRYCGSIGPLALAPPVQATFERIGNVLTAGFGLRGLFGIDGVLCDGVFWPVEVNPRYTASVEVLEHALGTAALAWHGRVFEPDLPQPDSSPPLAPGTIVGKAILFAQEALTFPATGPWSTVLARRDSPWALPEFADIPRAGEPIAAGRPVLSFFVRADSIERAFIELQTVAAHCGSAA